MLSWILFETAVGSLFLTTLETKAGLAIVKESWLANQKVDLAVPETQPGQDAEKLQWEPSAAASITLPAQADN